MISDCGEKMRPFPRPSSVELVCDQPENHPDAHHAVLKDYAYQGSVSHITWLQGDRRGFRGAWRPCPRRTGCVLPANHRGEHAL